MKRKEIFKRLFALSLTAVLTSTTICSYPVFAGMQEVQENNSFKTADNDFVSLTGVTSVTTERNTVTIQYKGGESAKLTFLEDNIFRFNMEPRGQFQDTPTATNNTHVATIVQQLDSSGEYKKPSPELTGTSTYLIKTAALTLELAKDTALMTLKKANGTIIWEESEPLKYKGAKTIQTLKSRTDINEYFYGGGTQNGRFSHKGNIINILNSNNWVDGGVASPNPFYWTTAGYGVLRNTFKPGVYDFEKTAKDKVTTMHEEERFDAYYFVDDEPANLLKDYYKVTGNPALYPEFAFYLGHLNAYNRDAWKEAPVQNGTQGVKLEDGKYYMEANRNGAVQDGEIRETLNGTNAAGEEDGSYKFSARAVVDGHEANDMPFGWLLPNDGYGAGYGQTSNLDGNIANLKSFADYANTKGVKTGLWTQSKLTPDTTQAALLQRDLVKEVQAGTRVLKTDVAWVGPGYSFGLNGIKFAYDTIAATKDRPTIITLDGWGGTQRYGGIWTGDQTGGNWEYIRFHIPTYIGTGLSGQPNVGSDMDGIFGGNKIIQTRDFQWKAFTPLMLDMDGWGSAPKKPYIYGEDTTSINRMYLKLKAQLMPYIYTAAQEATQGKPMVRAMMLEFPEDTYTYGKETQYQYMFGSDLLVAPVYQNTQADTNGNDVRNDIYLPDENQVWIDYFSGKQYRGGQILNNFDTPIWKLPLFVKNGAIIPMYAEHNNPQTITETNPKGLDKTKRIIEFYPEQSSEFTLYEDDGQSVDNTNKDEVSYGNSLKTQITSAVAGGAATLTIKPSTGTPYTGYQANKDTTLVVNVSKKPTSIQGNIGTKAVTFTEVTTQEAFDQTTGNVYFYNATPNLNQYATSGSAFANTKITTTPKVYIKTEKVEATSQQVKVVVNGFENAGNLPANQLNANLAAPTNLATPEADITPAKIKVTWDAVAGATDYQLEVDGVINNGLTTSFIHQGLQFDSEHTYRVRSVNDQGFSAWSNLISAKTLLDPYRNSVKNIGISAIKADGTAVPDQGGTPITNMVDQDNNTIWHTKWSTVATPFDIKFDLKQVYSIESFEYLINGGNGTLQNTSMEYSLDGINYKTAWTNKNWNTNYSSKGTITEKFEVPIKGRYFKMHVAQGVGSFGSGKEFRFYAVDPIKGEVSGDRNSDGNVDDNDITFFTNYAGLNVTDADFGYIVDKNADVNYDKLIDAYDISYVTRMFDGGIKLPKAVNGSISMAKDKETAKAGETVTLTVNGNGLENVNAYSLEIGYDASKFEAKSVTLSSAASQMLDFSKIRTHSNGTANIYVIGTNKGVKTLLNGTQTLATVTLTAKVDADCNFTPSSAKLVGNDLSVVTTIGETVPPSPTTNTLIPRSVFDVTFINDLLKTDDGTNHTKLFQQSFEGLFNGQLDDVEFKWFLNAATFPAEVKLPTDFIFTLKTPKKMTKVEVTNRSSGTAASNGVVNSIKAAAIYGTTRVELGTITERKDVFVFNIPQEHLGRKFDKIIVTPLTSNGTATGATGGESNRMLTLSEIELYENSNLPDLGGGEVPTPLTLTELQAEITTAEAIDLSTKQDGTQKDTFRTMLAAAKAILANSTGKTQANVDKAKADLANAAKNLKDIETPPTPDVKNGWVMEDGKERYYENDVVKENILVSAEAPDTWYYAGPNGYKTFGFATIDSKSYYFDPITGILQTGKIQIGTDIYAFSSTGKMLTGLQQFGKETYLFADDGKMLTGWQKVGGAWYLFAGKTNQNPGKMLTGWQKDAGTWYLLDNSGKMLTGWQKSGGAWYLLAGSGKMLTGWQKDGSTWYLLAGSGKMLTGWQKSGGAWYLLSSGGKMLTGWQKVGSTWYLLAGSGKMLTGWQKVGSTWYLLAGSGKMLTGWQKDGSTWYLLAGSGKMLTGWQKSGGAWYLLASSGKMLTGWQKVGNNWYLLANSGKMLTGWQRVGTKLYYLAPGTGIWDGSVR